MVEVKITGHFNSLLFTVVQDVGVLGRLRRTDRRTRQSPQARHEPIQQVLSVVGDPPAQGTTDQTQRAVPHRVRVLFGVPHHTRAGHPAATQEGLPPGAEQDAGQDDHGSRKEAGRPRCCGLGAQAAIGQRPVAQPRVYVEKQPVPAFYRQVVVV